MKEADGLLACSRGLARDAQAWATEGLARPFEVIYNGIDATRFSPARSAEEKTEARRKLGLPEDKKLLLSVATPIALKGWIELMDAFAALGDAANGWEIVMAGARRNQNDLDLVTEAKSRRISARWLGAVSPQMMPDLYRASDAFVSASYNEGLSNAMIEAMASALPVVVTRVGGHAEIITDGINGRLVEPRDAAALKSALGAVLTDEGEAERMGRAARERAIEIGDHRANAAVLFRYFENLLRDLRRVGRENEVERVARYWAS
jgi:glycosyltransferase involved in cell wall biosynthesis